MSVNFPDPLCDETANCILLLLDVYRLSLPAYRDLLLRLINPSPVLYLINMPRFWAAGRSSRTPPDPSHTVHCMCASVTVFSSLVPCHP